MGIQLSKSSMFQLKVCEIQVSLLSNTFENKRLNSKRAFAELNHSGSLGLFYIKGIPWSSSLGADVPRSEALHQMQGQPENLGVSEDTEGIGGTLVNCNPKGICVISRLENPYAPEHTRLRHTKIFHLEKLL